MVGVCVKDNVIYKSHCQGVYVTKTSLFDRLKEERKRLGLTQAEAAALAPVQRETWGRYESGALAPGMEVLEAFALAGADVQYVLTGTRGYDPAPSLKPDEDVLLDAYRALEPSMRRRVLAFILGGEPPPAAPRKVKQTVESGVGQQYNGPVETVAKGDIHSTGKEKKS